MVRERKLQISKKVQEEIESFKLEYPGYDSEHVEEYVRLLQDTGEFSPKEIQMFINALY